MAEKRADAFHEVHPALQYIREHGMTRKEAAKKLGGVNLVVLNHVLDRVKKTTERWVILFHEKFEIPLEKLIGIKVRPIGDAYDAKAFEREHPEAVARLERERAKKQKAREKRTKRK